MKYCIGEFSSLLGITRDTLRLYEKHDIVRPVKDRHNSYRYFNDLDARDLLMSRWYRSLQIPLQDVASLIQNASLDDILNKMEQSKRELEEEIRKSTMLLHKLDELSREVQNLEGRLYRCTLGDRPGLYRLKQTDKNHLLNTKGLEGTINALMEVLPYSFIASASTRIPSNPRRRAWNIAGACRFRKTRCTNWASRWMSI